MSETKREKALRAYHCATVDCEDLVKPGWAHVMGTYAGSYRHNIQDPNGMPLVPSEAPPKVPGGWSSRSRDDAQARYLVAAANLVPHILTDAQAVPELRRRLEAFELTAWQLRSVGFLDRLRAKWNIETLDSIDHLEQAAMDYERRGRGEVSCG